MPQKKIYAGSTVIYESPIVTSTTRPTSPETGTVIYESDTYKLLQYTTATTGWVPPWNLPWGFVAYAYNAPPTNTAMTNYTVVTTNLTGVPANRRYKVTATITSVGSPAITNPDLSTDIRFGGVTITAVTSKAVGVFGSPGWFVNHNMTQITTTGAGGSITVAARVTLVGSNAFVGGCNLIIEDIGPATNPT